ncbi:MAG: hypothetical protein LBK66_02195 [Spirochaetaceae bacterium]|jgi:uncharacterized coiled-coil protein SlyX|nr:hypothetical protein [Spirochaetaceae bacterium]
METSNETLAPPLGEGLTFEKVWAALMELRAFQKAMGEETDRRMQETDRRMQETAQQIKETDKQIKETDKQIKETGKQIKETGKQVGKITNRFGEIVEHMVAPNLVEKFQVLGFTFTKAGLNIKITDKAHNIFAEVDVFLENGDKVMIVEIKSKPDKEDIKNHIKRIQKLRLYADLHADKRKYMGAIAGVVFNDEEKDYALSNGLYVLEPSGETFSITTPSSKGHTPQEW